MSPRAATTATFFANGAVVGTWVADIPWAQARLGISKGTLGLTLLCMAAGALVAMPLTGQVLDRRPSGSVTRAIALVYCLLLPLPLLAPTPVVLGLALFALGAANGGMDVAMNAHGVAVERELGRPIMSSLHAGWSFGGFAGAGLVALAGALALDPRIEGAAVAAAVWVLAFVATARLGSATAQSGAEEARSGFTLPSRGVALLGVLCVISMVVEGAMGDWSGVYLRGDLGAGTGAAAIGYTGFSLGMALARVGGDALNRRLGADVLLRGGMVLVAVALGGLLAAGQPVVAVVGFTLIGLGVANAVPLLFSAAGRMTPPGPSLAAVSTMGYFGFIIGPPLIGFLADAIGLPLTLALLCPAAALVALLAGSRASAPAPRAEPARA